jgi:RNA polymerase sigma factor (sigma-70 family)
MPGMTTRRSASWWNGGGDGSTGCARVWWGIPGWGRTWCRAAFARVYEKRGDYRPSARFSTYLWRVTVNLCHDEIRRGRTRCWFGTGGVEAGTGAEDAGPDRGEVVDVVSGEPTPSSLVADREEGALVREAVLGLAEPYRTVLVLRHYQDLKLREIAEILEVPDGTVHSRLAEALTRLARVLGPRLQAAPASIPGPAPLPLPLPERERSTGRMAGLSPSESPNV